MHTFLFGMFGYVSIGENFGRNEGLESEERWWVGACLCVCCVCVCVCVCVFVETDRQTDRQAGRQAERENSKTLF